ncbi:MAG: SMC-Scp complex subunit ScpB [bacterium]
MSTKSKIESILFASTKPLSVAQLKNILNCETQDIKKALEELEKQYNQKGSGINLINNLSKYQLATSPDNSKIIQDMLKSEMTGELTRPSLETLTVISYRGPISRAELEQIRGVNCSLILRNLMMRGLVESYYDKQKAVTLYNITLDFMRFLGINNVGELPDYEKLNQSEDLVKLLEKQNNEE